MNNTYLFDHFQNQQQKAEIDRLTSNVGSHSKPICEFFINNGLLSSKRVLDVGCGTGAMLDLFANIIPDTQFVGVDSSQIILNQAKQINKSNIDWVNGEASSLPFDDNSFDFVYTRLVLLHNQSPISIINEMKRVCKPDGVIICVDIDDGTMVFHPYGEEFAKLIQAYIAYSKTKGMDRTMGRKLFALYHEAGIQQVKVVVQTSDFEGAFDEIPFPLRLAIGDDEGQHLVQSGFITEEERVDYVQKIKLFSQHENRFYSGSFMYAVGRKHHAIV